MFRRPLPQNTVQFSIFCYNIAIIGGDWNQCIPLFLSKAEGFLDSSGKFALKRIVRFVRWEIKTIEAEERVSRTALTEKSN